MFYLRCGPRTEEGTLEATAAPESAMSAGLRLGSVMSSFYVSSDSSARSKDLENCSTPRASPSVAARPSPEFLYLHTQTHTRSEQRPATAELKTRVERAATGVVANYLRMRAVTIAELGGRRGKFWFWLLEGVRRQWR